MCHRQRAIANDGFHSLSCHTGSTAEVCIRHNAVVDALHHTALTVGVQAAREPVGLDLEDGRRPDLQIVFLGEHILSDVVVCLPLSPSYVDKAAAGGVNLIARKRQQSKHIKYEETANTSRACL
jgi:hypothetical protein